ncbi:MAG TPA: hypothetical protein PLC05_03350 [bacterium]|nr:hypothetical protein [bacterium]HOR57804.1 hypothetical protein [bacterium]HPL56497.1 hypothetical protein [bacterium]
MNSFLHIFSSAQVNEETVSYLSAKYKWSQRLEVFDATSLDIKTLRQFLNFAAKKPIDNVDIYLVIFRAEYMSREVVNALLKIIEEPPSYLFIHLVTTSEHKVIETMVSRCQRIRHNFDNTTSDKWDWQNMDLIARMEWARELATDPEMEKKLAYWLEEETRLHNWRLAGALSNLLHTLAKSNANKQLQLENFVIKNSC